MKISELKKIEEAATEGPWMIIDRRIPSDAPAEILTIFSAPRGAHGSVICRIQNSVKMGPLEKEDDSNAALIVSSRNHFRALLKVVEAAEESQRCRGPWKDNTPHQAKEEAADDALAAALRELEVK